jgi:hypothetical protein
VKKAKTDPAVDSRPPSAREVASQLGRSHAAFLAITQRGPGVTREWKRYTRTSPWTLKVSQGDRTLLYATPRADAFEATAAPGVEIRVEQSLIRNDKGEVTEVIG